VAPIDANLHDRTFQHRNPPLTAPQLAVTFVPFELGLVASMLLAEQTQDLRLFRTLFSVRTSMLLALPALALFPFRDRTAAGKNLWRLFWTWSFLAYAVHLAYAWFGVFGGQLEAANLYKEAYHFDITRDLTVLDLVLQHQGPTVFYSNVAVTILWLIDILLTWVSVGSRGVVAGVHALAWLGVLAGFLVASILFFKNATTYQLGWLMVGVVAIAILVRVFSRRPDRHLAADSRS
jgi:hypothetical protein